MENAAVEATPGREWAVGLTQGEFDVEYIRRHPTSDIIPDVATWPFMPEPEYNGVSPVLPEDYVSGPTEVAGIKAAPPPASAEAEKPPLVCPGCHMEFKWGRGAKMLWTNHVKKCKAALQKGE
jgi:hypothetical protein